MHQLFKPLSVKPPPGGRANFGALRGHFHRGSCKGSNEEIPYRSDFYYSQTRY